MSSPIEQIESAEMNLLLKRFFAAEMPKPWPVWDHSRASTGFVQPSSASDSLRRSRLTLIVATSLLCGFVALMNSYIGGPTSNSPRPEKGLIENGTAKTPKELLKTNR